MKLSVWRQAGSVSRLDFVLWFIWKKNQPGSRDEIINVIIQVGINEQAYCTFKNIIRVYLCCNSKLMYFYCYNKMSCWI